MGRYGQNRQSPERNSAMHCRPEIPFEDLWDEDVATIEDQLYTDRALTDMEYRYALECVIEEKLAAQGGQRIIPEAQWVKRKRK